MTLLRIVIFWFFTLGTTVWAQGLPGGSNGSSGALNITTDTTLNLPDDGVFHATTINVASGATLTFNRNAANTPVFLLATGNITIAGTLNVSGSDGTDFAGGPGGPGGFDGGAPGFDSGAPGDGLGPGAGGGARAAQAISAGGGAYGAAPTFLTSVNDGTSYGSSLVIPLAGGSGGGGSANVGGGGGGGAVLLASDTLVHISGSVIARGAEAGTSSFNAPGGSGGAIRIVARQVTGAGMLDVRGGGSCRDGCGGRGRIRIDVTNRAELALQASPASALSVGGLLFVAPEVLPRLDILRVAGQDIAESATEPVRVLLPAGSPSSQTVIVQGRDFTGIVPIHVVVTPDSGSRTVIEAEIDMNAGNPATVTVTVDIPANILTYINAWTR